MWNEQFFHQAATLRLFQTTKLPTLCHSLIKLMPESILSQMFYHYLRVYRKRRFIQRCYRQNGIILL